MFVMSCDRCFSNIDYDENEVYHATGIKDGILNRHLHLCKGCYEKTFGCFLEIEEIKK